MSSDIFKKYLKKPDPEKAHAKYSASGSERWLGCPASVSLSEGISSIESVASLRGTHTHTLLQFVLENEDWMNLLQTKEGVKFQMAINYDRAMMMNVRYAASVVWAEEARMEKLYGRKVKLLTEAKVELKGVGFGTADIILYHPYGLLHVMDYKNGTKSVEPEHNTQGLYYAYAAADMFNWEFSDLHITIIQPNAAHRLGQARTWKTNEETLRLAGIRFKRGVEATKKLDAPVVKNDSWCWFCPAKRKCPAHEDIRDKKLKGLFGIGVAS